MSDPVHRVAHRAFFPAGRPDLGHHRRVEWGHTGDDRRARRLGTPFRYRFMAHVPNSGRHVWTLNRRRGDERRSHDDSVEQDRRQQPRGQPHQQGDRGPPPTANKTTRVVRSVDRDPRNERHQARRRRPDSPAAAAARRAEGRLQFEDGPSDPRSRSAASVAGTDAHRSAHEAHREPAPPGRVGVRYGDGRGPNSGEAQRAGGSPRRVWTMVGDKADGKTDVPA